MTGDIKIKAIINGEINAETSVNGHINTKTIIGDAGVGRIVVEKHDSAPYEGQYELTPSAQAQFFDTKDKRMVDDLTVKAIPYFDVANEYGRTIIIGGETNA